MGRMGIIGGGNMGSALARGLLAKGMVAAADLVVAEKIPERAAQLGAELGVVTAPWPARLDPVEVLIVAVKPPDVAEALTHAHCALRPTSLVISVAAGVTLAALAKNLPADQPLVRVIPNTPCLIGEGITGLAPAATATPEQVALAKGIFGAVGQVVEINEKLMDAATGLSGSGPAFVYLFIEALSDAGVRQGIDRPTSLALAAATVAGAARLVMRGDRHPAQLKDMVTSPGGTTIAGLHELEKGGIRGVIMDAVAAATQRSRELGS